MFSIAVLNFFDLYTYNNSGNILEKITYPYFDTAYPTVEPVRRDNYSYPMDSWSDRLVVFNDEQCEYDSIGNPTLYRGKTLTWQYGRQLTKFNNVAYNYYSDGLRRQKNVNGLSTDYIWSDNRLVAENKVAKNLLFKYGISGILGFSVDDINYTYRKNLQGDITDIVDDSGKVVAHYDYDAYGNQRIYGYHDNQWLLLEDTLTHEGIYSNTTLPIQLPYVLSDKEILKNNHIAYINPFRYRSYYYDTETNLYYLTTRYYDPETGRFINADDISYADPETINGLNLFAYCGNNPVMLSDSSGCSPFWDKFWAGVVGFFSVAAIVGGAILTVIGIGAPIGAMLMGAGIGGVIGMGGSIVSQGLSNGWGNINWGQVAFNGAIGLGTGALMASPLGAIATEFAVGGLGFTQSVGNDLFASGGNWSKVNWGKAVLLGSVSGLIAGGGKFLTNSSTLMNKFVNSSSVVKTLGAKSLELGLAGRGSYISYWMNVMIMQTIYRTGTSVIMNGMRGGIQALINLLW